MKLTQSLLLTSFFLLSASFGILCAEDAKSSDKDIYQPSSAVADDIMPRFPESKWLYRSQYFYDGQPDGTGSTLEEVIETKELEGQTIYLIRMTFDWRSLMEKLGGVELTRDDYYYFWEYYDEDGSYNFVREEEYGRHEPPASLEEFELTLPYPVAAGYTYSAEESDWKVLATDEIVTVPAGKFKCVVYQDHYVEEGDDGYESRGRMYLAPGVGVVVAEGDSRSEQGEWVTDYRDELISFDLKMPEDSAPKSE